MQALRGDPSTAQIPVLVFSSLPQANELKLKDEGAAGYFEKSRLAEQVAAGAKELIQLIENIVGKSRERDKPPARTSHVTVAGAS